MTNQSISQWSTGNAPKPEMVIATTEQLVDVYLRTNAVDRTQLLARLNEAEPTREVRVRVTEWNTANCS
jgi:hypothetical protein